MKRGLVTSNNDKKYRAPLILTKEGKETACKIDTLASTAVEAGSNGLTTEEIFMVRSPELSEQERSGQPCAESVMDLV